MAFLISDAVTMLLICSEDEFTAHAREFEERVAGQATPHRRRSTWAALVDVFANEQRICEVLALEHVVLGVSGRFVLLLDCSQQCSSITVRPIVTEIQHCTYVQSIGTIDITVFQLQPCTLHWMLSFVAHQTLLCH
eukprot:8375-Heterococcus_DN1.PRE.3